MYSEAGAHPRISESSRFGATFEETIGTPDGGNFAQACVIDAAREIAAEHRDLRTVYA